MKIVVFSHLAVFSTLGTCESLDANCTPLFATSTNDAAGTTSPAADVAGQEYGGTYNLATTAGGGDASTTNSGGASTTISLEDDTVGDVSASDTSTSEGNAGTSTGSNSSESTESDTECTMSSTDTAATPICGDGLVQDGEDCDDANAELDDDCLACVWATCGDGFVWSAYEACDTSGASMTCDVDCTAPMCGDGMVNAAAGETCDKGPSNGSYGSGCNLTCDGPSATCGDGLVNTPNETCDTNVAVSHGICNPICLGFICDDSWEDCDGKAGNGCESWLMTKNNCGGCDIQCATCYQGSCE